MTPHATEIAGGKRFEFGKNWAHYLPIVDDQRIIAAERSLQDALGRDRLDGLSFLDIGSTWSTPGECSITGAPCGTRWTTSHMR